ncbi:MAG: isocitrate lyase/phosphoenolpyruvate mutase family protein [Bacteroidota bacterium]
MSDKFNLFKQLHVKGNPLLLYNIWDAGSAKAVVEAGAPVVATGSKPIALSQGFPDGEVMPFDRVIDTVATIVKAVDVPVSADFEAGYANDDEGLLAANTARLLDTGIIGLNLEDNIIKEGTLRDPEVQANCIALLRKVAEDKQAALFINARTDLFLREKDKSKHAGLMADAITRAQHYAAAGADGFFAPGLDNAELIAQLCEATALPVNIVKVPTAPGNSTLAECGVSRISYGPFAYVALMQEFQERAKQVMQRQVE